MSQYWYTLHSHPRKEEVLCHQMETHGVEVFYPRLRVNPVNPRARKVLPYFPGYMFVHVDITQTGLSFFQWMPFATGLVSFGGEPAVVPDALINAIRQRTQQIAASGGETFDGLIHGDVVLIHDGPFAGYEGIFDVRLPGNERVRVLLKMLSERNLPVELNVGQIKKKKPKFH
jgi:transcription antitermination factor NusG